MDTLWAWNTMSIFAFAAWSMAGPARCKSPIPARALGRGAAAVAAGALPPAVHCAPLAEPPPSSFKEATITPKSF